MKKNLCESLQEIYLEYNLPKNTVPPFFKFSYKFFEIWNLYLDIYSEEEINMSFKNFIYKKLSRQKEKNKRIALQNKVFKYKIIFDRFINSILKGYNEKLANKEVSNPEPYKRANTILSTIKLSIDNNKPVKADSIKSFAFFENNFTNEEIFDEIRFDLKYLPKNLKYLDTIISDLKSLKE